MILSAGCLYLYKTADDPNFTEAIPLTKFRYLKSTVIVLFIVYGLWLSQLFFMVMARRRVKSNCCYLRVWCMTPFSNMSLTVKVTLDLVKKEKHGKILTLRLALVYLYLDVSGSVRILLQLAVLGHCTCLSCSQSLRCPGEKQIYLDV